MAPDPRRAAAALRAPTPLPARRRPLTPATRCDPLPSLLRRGGMVRTEKIRCECRRRPLARGSKWCQRRCNPPATLRAAAAVCCECDPRPRCMPSAAIQSSATTTQAAVGTSGCCRSMEVKTGMVIVAQLPGRYEPNIFHPPSSKSISIRLAFSWASILVPTGQHLARQYIPLRAGRTSSGGGAP